MVLAEIRKTVVETIKVSVQEYQGATFIDCRVYWLDENGEWRPTRKGIALSRDVIDDVIEALRKGREALPRRGEKTPATQDSNL